MSTAPRSNPRQQGRNALIFLTDCRCCDAAKQAFRRRSGRLPSTVTPDKARTAADPGPGAVQCASPNALMRNL
jgi:hypothetical protein